MPAVRPIIADLAPPGNYSQVCWLGLDRHGEIVGVQPELEEALVEELKKLIGRARAESLVARRAMAGGWDTEVRTWFCAQDARGYLGGPAMEVYPFETAVLHFDDKGQVAHIPRSNVVVARTLHDAMVNHAEACAAHFGVEHDPGWGEDAMRAIVRARAPRTAHDREDPLPHLARLGAALEGIR